MGNQGKTAAQSLPKTALTTPDPMSPCLITGYMWTPHISPSRRLYEPEARDLHSLIFWRKSWVQGTALLKFSRFPAHLA